jgi:hypothetical protein
MTNDEKKSLKILHRERERLNFLRQEKTLQKVGKKNPTN